VRRDMLTDTGVFRTTLCGRFAVLVVGGEIDMSNAEAFREQLRELTAGDGAKVIVDLSLVQFMDSAGLGVLIGGLKQVRLTGGSLRVVGTSAHLIELFHITGIYKVLPLHLSVADAAQI
jgi:anti-sigma B factor antagonist